MNKGLKKQIFRPRGLAVNSVMTKQLKFVLQRPHFFGLIFDISFFLLLTAKYWSRMISYSIRKR